MNRITTVKLGGKKGVHIFDVYSVDEKFDHSAGIYAFTSRDTEGNHKVLYVGQTNDLAVRMADHEKMDCAKRRGMNRICFCEVNTQAKRDEFEEDLIKEYQPPCNELLK